MFRTAFIGWNRVDELREFAEPVWREVFSPMLIGGEEEAMYLFNTWQSKDAVLKDMEDSFLYGFAFDGGKKIGYFCLRIEGESMFISKCYLHRDARHKGFGSALQQFMIQYGREHGCSRAYLHVNVRNVDAIRSYKRNGFQITLHEVTDRGCGNATNDYVMEREI